LQTYNDLVKIVLDILQRIPQPIGWVCGPISNGGRGSFDENLKEFTRVIIQLRKQGKNIFNQLPFESSLLRIGSYTLAHNAGEKTKLLQGFYQPIFESDLVTTLYFIPDWQSSSDATWEHAQGQRLNLKIVYLD
jgi:hypothetical protein